MLVLNANYSHDWCGARNLRRRSACLDTTWVCLFPSGIWMSGPFKNEGKTESLFALFSSNWAGFTVKTIHCVWFGKKIFITIFLLECNHLKWQLTCCVTSEQALLQSECFLFPTVAQNGQIKTLVEGVRQGTLCWSATTTQDTTKSYTMDFKEFQSKGQFWKTIQPSSSLVSVIVLSTHHLISKHGSNRLTKATPSDRIFTTI